MLTHVVGVVGRVQADADLCTIGVEGLPCDDGGIACSPILIIGCIDVVALPEEVRVVRCSIQDDRLAAQGEADLHLVAIVPVTAPDLVGVECVPVQPVAIDGPVRRKEVDKRYGNVGLLTPKRN